jgi:hypothetical protein
MPSPGDRLAGRYQLIQQIGAGGMATVWRARDLRLGRPVAIKLLRPELAEDEDLARRFESEARHAASLSHPNVAGVYDTEVDPAGRFIVMELVDGPTLADVIAQQGRLEPALAVQIAAAAARALSAAHRRGLVHRDVKPANLLIGRDGRVRLADFGIARALTGSRVTTPGTVLGSIPYLSPEQARGEEATAASDIFSLGVVLFEMLTGRLPWHADTPAAMATMRLHVPPPVPSVVAHDIPAGLDTIVLRALDVNPIGRYPSARVLADALGAWRRRHVRGDVPARLAGATAAIAAQIARGGGAGAGGGTGLSRAGAGAAVAGAAGVGTVAAVARPNPLIRLPRSAGDTRRGGPPPAPPPRGPTTDPGPVAAAPASTRSRRAADLLLAALAVGLLLAVGVGMLLGPAGTPDPTAVAGVPAPSPMPTPVTAPTASPTPMPTPPPVLPTPSPRETEAPPTPAPPTPRPTPRPTDPPPQASAAARAVVAFYDAVERHDWETATNLWSPSMQQRYPPDEWLVDRFRRTTRIDITRLQTVALNRDAGTARVQVSLVEYRTVEPSPRTFVGAWDLVRIDGRWLLDQPYF